MENREIADWQITASSEYGHNYAAMQGRLHFQADAGKVGSWSALINDVNQWLQIDLIGQYIVTRVATQGRDDLDQWVKTYKLEYGDDGNNFQLYREQGRSTYKVKINFINFSIYYSFSCNSYQLDKQRTLQFRAVTKETLRAFTFLRLKAVKLSSYSSMHDTRYAVC